MWVYATIEQDIKIDYIFQWQTEATSAFVAKKQQKINFFGVKCCNL